MSASRCRHEQVRALAIAILSVALAANAAPADRDAAKNPVDDFFKAFNAQPDTFAEYRFLTSPAVQQDAQTRNMASQMVATHLSFLGRPVDALRAFPFGAPMNRAAVCPRHPAGGATPASDWIAAQADDYRVVMVNEAHHAPQTRVLTIALLQRLREKGYTHLAVGSPAQRRHRSDAGQVIRCARPASIPASPCSPNCCARRVGLGYSLLALRKPNEPGEQTQQQRETGQASAIADLLAKELAREGAGTRRLRAYRRSAGRPAR